MVRFSIIEHMELWYQSRAEVLEIVRFWLPDGSVLSVNFFFLVVFGMVWVKFDFFGYFSNLILSLRFSLKGYLYKNIQIWNDITVKSNDRILVYFLRSVFVILFKYEYFVTNFYHARCYHIWVIIFGEV